MFNEYLCLRIYGNMKVTREWKEEEFEIRKQQKKTIRTTKTEQCVVRFVTKEHIEKIHASSYGILCVCVYEYVCVC